MKTTTTELRMHLAKYLDHLLKTGETIELKRNGRIVRISADPPASSLSRLKRRDTIVGDPEGIVSTDWSGLWTGGDDDLGTNNVP
jgi:antitoxin (DNA-binding transcriptional repressor) of toxin-antitoxin stability system